MADTNNSRLVGFTPGGARKIAKATNRVLSTAWAGDPRRGRIDRWTPGATRAKCTTAIPTGTFDSPSSSGEVQIYRRNASGDWEASGDPVQCWNQLKLDASVAVDTACFVAWISGQWWLTQADCPES